MKNTRIYTSFDPERILGRSIDVVITDKSGHSGVTFWVNKYLKLKGDTILSKHDPGIEKIYQWICDQYSNHHRITAISTEEMIHLIKKYLPNYLQS